MRALSLAVLCLSLALPATRSAAQEAVSQPLEIGPGGQDYLDAIRYRGIDTDVAYFDPTGAVPRLDTDQTPPPPPRDPVDLTVETASTARIVTLVVVAAILIVLALIIYRSAGNMTLSLQGAAQNPGRGKARRAGGAGRDPAEPADLRAILATADRRRALVMLAQAALARTVAANGMLLQPSWTMRDALRRIPRAQAHLDALRGLVMAGERVLFGNRDVTEDEFQAQLAAIRPLLRDGGAG